MSNTTLVESVERGGNTSPPASPSIESVKSKRISASRRWCFTLNNYTEKDMVALVEKFKGFDLHYIVGKEVCPSTGTPHLQGYIESKGKLCFRPMEKFMTTKVHWEKCKGSRDENVKYCSKDGDYITNMKVPRPIADPLKGVELHDWQKEIIDLIKTTPDPRHIYWYWERNGNVGKTALCKHICMNYNAIMLSGKASDIKYGIINYIADNKEVDVAIFHYVRSNEEYVSYDALESVKDGIFYSSKYESKMCIFNSPHIIVFANFAPNYDAISLDRWIVTEL